MENSKFLIILSSLILLLTSCGRSIENADYSFNRGDMRRLEVVMKDHTVSCQGANCPDAIAKVIIKNSRGVGQCSGFLIKKNFVLTNGHCIPKQELKSYHQCNDKIAVLFPTNQKSFEENARCKKVHRYSQGKGKIDYLLFELDRKVDREPLEVKQSGVVNNEKFVAWTMNPVSTTHGHFVKKDCTSLRDTLLIPDGKTRYFPVVAFGSCLSIPGNSGSPIIDENGKVRAVVAGVFKREYLQLITQAKPLYETAALFLRAENTACMDLRAAGYNNIHGKCKNHDMKNPFRLTPGKTFKKEIAMAKIELKNKIAANQILSQNFQFRTNINVRVGGTNIIQPSLNCINDEVTQLEMIPEWIVKVGYNKYLQPVTVIKEQEQKLTLNRDVQGLQLSSNSLNYIVPNCSQVDSTIGQSSFHSKPQFHKPDLSSLEIPATGWHF